MRVGNSFLQGSVRATWMRSTRRSSICNLVIISDMTFAYESRTLFRNMRPSFSIIVIYLETISASEINMTRLFDLLDWVIIFANTDPPLLLLLLLLLLLILSGVGYLRSREDVLCDSFFDRCSEGMVRPRTLLCSLSMENAAEWKLQQPCPITIDQESSRILNHHDSDWLSKTLKYSFSIY